MAIYSVKEMFYTLQGEGAQAGRAAVFLRFAGCNLWSGREQDRADAICNFCDTDFIGTDGDGGGKFGDPAILARAAKALWAGTSGVPYIVCTGGEPMLQLDAPLIDALHAEGFEIAAETNGTIKAPSGIDWLCVSPKSTAPLEQTSGNELKLAYPQPDALPDQFADLGFDFFSLQPIDGPSLRANTRAAIEYCKKHPKWRVSLQTHKIMGIA